MHPALALTALTDVDVELAVDGFAWNLHLELLGDVSFVEGSAAVRAGAGQGRLVNLVDLFGGRWLAVGLGAIILARFAAWFAQVGLGLALGEGACLAFAGTEGGVELATEPLDFGLQVVNSSLKGLAVGTSDHFHAGIIRSKGRCSSDGGNR